jgi:phage tail-like protein
MPRSTPYLAFNFQVSLTQNSGTTIPLGGFSDVSGLSTEITDVEYRMGNATESRVDKYPGIYKTGDVTLKRGLINATDISDWVEATRTGKPKGAFQGTQGKQDSVIVKLLDEARNPVASWTLRSVHPKKWTGPTLAGKGGADVAMEELVLSVEKIEFAML